jgi:hypothetical protein
MKKQGGNARGKKKKKRNWKMKNEFIKCLQIIKVSFQIIKQNLFLDKFCVSSSFTLYITNLLIKSFTHYNYFP